MAKTWKKQLNYGSVLRYYQKNGNKIISWIDYLSLDLCYTDTQKELFCHTYNGFSTNSDEFNFKLDQFEWLKFKVNILYRSYFTRLEVTVSCDEFSPISIFSIFVNKTNSKAVFTGKYFRYCQLKSIPYRELGNLLINRFDDFSPNRDLWKLRIIRWDYKVDVFGVKPNQVITRLKDYNKRTHPVLSKKQSTFIDNWEIETHYIGSRQSKYIFCRVYNKFIDTAKKWNEELYFDYPNPTTRLEWQAGSQFNGDLTLDEWLIKLSSYIGVTNFHEWPYYIARRYDPDVIVNIERYYENTDKRLQKLIYNKVDITPLCLQTIDRYKKYKSKQSDDYLFYYDNNFIYEKIQSEFGKQQ